MAFLNLLTLLFVGANLWGIIDWSWWIVMSPTLFNIAILLVVITLVAFKK